MKSWLNFCPSHREDLAASGLTLRTVVNAGVYSMRPRDVQRKIKCKALSDINSVLAFPYFLEDGFERYKIFWMDGVKDGFRYYQKKGVGSRLYVTKLFVDTCVNGGELYITEGEKKALALSQRKYPACALSGVWNFSDAVLMRLKDLKVKRMTYIPDDDVFGREDLERSVIRFNEVLSAIGCKIEILKKNT